MFEYAIIKTLENLVSTKAIFYLFFAVLPGCVQATDVSIRNSSDSTVIFEFQQWKDKALTMADDWEGPGTDFIRHTNGCTINLEPKHAAILNFAGASGGHWISWRAINVNTKAVMKMGVIKIDGQSECINIHMEDASRADEELFKILRQSIITNDFSVFEKNVDQFHDINMQDENGQTLIHMSVSLNRKQMVQKLLLKSPDLETRDSNSFTALHDASSSGHIDLVAMMLNAGSKVDALDFGGVTPLMLACQMGHIQVVEMLVKHGANINHRAVRYEGTPLSEARRFNRWVIVEFLKKHGAVDE